jgi:HlyD family secretion protein
MNFAAVRHWDRGGIGSILAIALAATAILGCEKVGLPVEKKSATTAVVARQDVIGYAFFDGKVVTPPGAMATVVSPYDVAIGEVLVSQGRWVGRGATIIRMNLPNAQGAVDQAELNLQAAKSAYASAKAQYDAPVRQAERALDQARAAERKARTDVQSGLPADLQSATDAREMAEDAFQSAIATRNSQLSAERQAVAISQEMLEDARRGAAVANIRAPISGTIVSLEAKPGLVVKSRQQLASIVDLGAIEIQAVVPAELSKKVERGTQVLIALDGANSEPFEGTVTDVDVMPPSTGQESQGYLAVIDFNNEKGWVLPGSVVKRVGVKTGEAKDVLVVPTSAVEKGSDGKSFVEVQSGTEWVRKPVETGLTDGVIIEVKSGLTEGEVVKLRG